MLDSQVSVHGCRELAALPSQRRPRRSGAREPGPQVPPGEAGGSLGATRHLWAVRKLRLCPWSVAAHVHTRPTVPGRPGRSAGRDPAPLRREHVVECRGAARWASLGPCCSVAFPSVSVRSETVVRYQSWREDRPSARKRGRSLVGVWAKPER